MRVLALLAVVTASAAAEPKKPDSVKLPDIVKEATKEAKLPDRTGVLGMDGNLSAAIVITPPAHPDAKPVDQGGSWLVPPDPNDPMVIEPGTNQLRARTKVEPWLPRDLSRIIKRGADKVWDFVLPKL